MISRCKIGTVKPFQKNLKQIRKNFPESKKRIEEFIKAIRKTIHENCYIPKKFKPKLIKKDSLSDNTKEKENWKNDKIYSVEITKGIRFFYYLDEELSNEEDDEGNISEIIKTVFVFFDCGTHGDFYKNKSHGKSS